MVCTGITLAVESVMVHRASMLAATNCFQFVPINDRKFHFITIYLAI